jgi:hypothetical protein
MSGGGALLMSAMKLELAPVPRRALQIPGPVLIDVPIDYRGNSTLIQAMCSEVAG